MDEGARLYRELIAPIEDRLVAITGRILRDGHEAADALQDTLAWVWAHLPRLRRHPNPQAYILRKCLCRCYDLLHRRARQRRCSSQLPANMAAVEANVGEQLADREAARAVRDAIATLPRKQGQAVLLRLVDSSDYRFIADVLGCSPQTARSHVSKGIARLQRDLARRGFASAAERNGP